MDAGFVRVDQARTSQTGTVKYASWLRRTHRWIAVLFLLTVAANFTAMLAGAHRAGSLMPPCRPCLP